MAKEDYKAGYYNPMCCTLLQGKCLELWENKEGITNSDVDAHTMIPRAGTIQSISRNWHENLRG
jgi:hypothetical protein